VPSSIANQQWVFIALAFFGIIAYIVWIRWRDRRWIDAYFHGRKSLAMSFGVGYFGRAAEPDAPRHSSGFLLLFSDRLFYRSRIKKIQVDIPTHAIRRVYHGRHHKGADLHQSLVKIDFINSDSRRDTVAFKVPYPPQWIRMIENTCLAKQPKGLGKN
jgi:hypothetical protein